MILISATDTVYYGRALNLAQTFRKTNPTGELYIYDLGMAQNERATLGNLCKGILDVPRINEYVLRPIRKHEKGAPGTVIGLYSWKPLIIHEEIKKHDQILWADAGCSIIKDLSPLWEFIRQNTYFIKEVCNLGLMINKYPIEKLKVSKTELETAGFSASFIGLTKKWIDSFALPVRQCCDDIELFRDDGSAFGGVIWGRHDQALLSLFAIRCGWKHCPQFHIPYLRKDLTSESIIYHGRGDIV